MEDRIYVVVSPDGYDILVNGALNNNYDPREFQVVIECVRSCGIEFFGHPVLVVKTLVSKGVAHYHAILAAEGGFAAEFDVIVRVDGGDPVLVITASSAAIGEITRTAVVRR